MSEQKSKSIFSRPLMADAKCAATTTTSTENKTEVDEPFMKSAHFQRCVNIQLSLREAELTGLYIPLIKRLGPNPYGKQVELNVNEWCGTCFEFLRMYYKTSVTTSSKCYHLIFGNSIQMQIDKTKQEIVRLEEKLARLNNDDLADC
jgi:hypothetical protein